MTELKSINGFLIRPTILVGKLFIILALAACHFAASLTALFIAFGASMSRFDTGGGAVTRSEMISASAATVLHFPLVLLTKALPPTSISSFPAGYTLFILNSMLWGIGTYYIAVWLKRKYEKQRINVQIATR